MKLNLFVVILFEFSTRLSTAEESYVMLDTPNTPLSGFCSKKALRMNIISRSFLCHLLPSLNLPFSRNRKNYKVIKSTDLDAMQSQTLIDEFPNYNHEYGHEYGGHEYGGHVPNFELDYSHPSRFHIPSTFSFGQQNGFPAKSEEVSSSEFQSIAPFPHNTQIIKPVSNTFEMPSNMKSTLTSPNMQRGNSQVYNNPSPDLNLASSMNKEQSYQTSPYNSVSSIDSRPLASRSHWWPTDKKVTTNNRDQTISLKVGKDTHQSFLPLSLRGKKTIAVDTQEGWTPIARSKNPNPNPNPNPNHSTESHVPKYKPVTYSPRVYYTSRTPTSTRPPLKHDYFKRDYLIDSSTNEAVINNYQFINPNNNINIKPTKKPKTRMRLPVIKKDPPISTTLANQVMDTTFAETTTPFTTTESEIIISKEHTDYTKSSVVYSINDSSQELETNSSIFDEKSNHDYIYYDTESKENTEPEEIYGISDNHSKTVSVRGEPWIDYPMFSSSTSSNFSCTNPGFYADKDFGCQVYHHCGGENYHQKFICPNGTLFNNQIQACDYWFHVDCTITTKTMGISYDKKDDLNVLGDNSRSFQMTYEKLKNGDKVHKLIENLKTFVQNVKSNDMNKTQIESKVDNETELSNKH